MSLPGNALEVEYVTSEHKNGSSLDDSGPAIPIVDARAGIACTGGSEDDDGGGAYWSGPKVWEPVDIASLERVSQQLVVPPALPRHEQVATGDPRLVQVRMVIEEKDLEIAPGVFIWVFTFNGSVPGPIIVVHEGDYVELTLVNPASDKLLHNIDLHASIGALGGGELTHVAPGQEVVLRFRTPKAGVFIYHCAPGGVMVPWHVTHGMNGAIMVLPRDGLKDPAGNPLRYDRSYYIGEQDYYIPRDEARVTSSVTTTRRIPWWTIRRPRAPSFQPILFSMALRGRCKATAS